MKKRVSVLLLSFLLVVSLLHCYAAAEKQTRSEENVNVLSDLKYDGSSSHVLISEQYSSYLGGSADDELTSFVFVEPGIVYLAGITASTDFSIVNGYQDSNAGGTDCFIMKLNIETNTVIYSTYIGGTDTDILSDIVVDDEGNLFATGHTMSEDFPIVNAYQSSHTELPNYDIFVLKLNPSGDELLYSTFFGSYGPDHGVAIDIDSAGNAYVFGNGYGGTIPFVNPLDDVRAFEDCYFMKFNSTCGLEFSSYIGGSGDDLASSIAVDDVGNVYLFGFTDSVDLPGLSGYDTSINGAKDCFVMKVNSTLSGIDYSTYVGGSGMDAPNHAIVDESGVVYVTGYTSSNNFPIVDGYEDEFGGGIDCFVFSLAADGSSLTYSTYLGGSEVDIGNSITTLSNEAIFVTGYTKSSDFPTTSGVDKSLDGEIDCFVSKLNLSTLTLEYSTYLGGSGNDYGEGIAIVADQDIIVAGYTDSEDFPTDTTHNGMLDWFLVEIPKPLASASLDMTLLLYVGIGIVGVIVIAVIVYTRKR